MKAAAGRRADRARHLAAHRDALPPGHLQIRDRFERMSMTMDSLSTVTLKLMSRRRKKTVMMMESLKVNSVMRMMTQRLKKGQVRSPMGLLLTPC